MKNIKNNFKVLVNNKHIDLKSDFFYNYFLIKN